MRREVLQKDKSGGARSALQCPGYKDGFQENVGGICVFSSSQNSQTSYFRNDGLINRLVLGQQYSATLWDLTKNKEKIASFSFSACKVSFPL